MGGLLRSVPEQRDRLRGLAQPEPDVVARVDQRAADISLAGIAQPVFVSVGDAATTYDLPARHVADRYPGCGPLGGAGQVDGSSPRGVGKPRRLFVCPNYKTVMAGARKTPKS